MIVVVDVVVVDGDVVVVDVDVAVFLGDTINTSSHKLSNALLKNKLHDYYKLFHGIVHVDRIVYFNVAHDPSLTFCKRQETKKKIKSKQIKSSVSVAFVLKIIIRKRNKHSLSPK